MILLDGPFGARLQEKGLDLSPPAWSARALRAAPDTIAALHREYAAAGAQVHRANTFRTTARAWGDGWQELARLAVKLARDAALPGQRVAGSIGPLEDCYRPDLSPPNPRPEHEALARVLADAKVDLVILETFPHPGEARAAVEAAVGCGLETWVSFTAGPDATLLTPAQVGAAVVDCVAAGARAVLVNCVAAERTLPYVQALGAAGVPFGAYANAATWGGTPVTADRYASLAVGWLEAGATIIGGCCGTDATYTAALERLRRRPVS